MVRKSLVALAAAATIGLATLASTEADARRGGGGGGHGFRGGGGGPAHSFRGGGGHFRAFGGSHFRGGHIGAFRGGHRHFRGVRFRGWSVPYVVEDTCYEWLLTRRGYRLVNVCVD